MGMENAPGLNKNTKDKIPTRITSSGLEEMDTAITINGVIYLPDSGFSPKTMVSIGQKIHSEPWFQELLMKNDDLVVGRESALSDVRNMVRDGWKRMSAEEQERRKADGGYYAEIAEKLLDFYSQYVYLHKDEKPEWFDKLDSEARRVLSFYSVWNRIDDFLPRFRFGQIPYAGINSYAVENVEMFEDLDDVFNLFRLNGIKQFGYKHDPLIEPSHPSSQISDFPHTRYRHVFDTMAIANLLGNNMRLSDKDMLILQIAGVTHDYRTPAGGDTTKLADMEAFDEDRNYREIFKTEKWQQFALKYGINVEDQDKLYQTILGQGTLGKLLDVSDKVSYVSRDVDMYLYRVVRLMIFGKEGEEQEYLPITDDITGYKSIQKLVESDPMVCSVWDSVDIYDDQIVFQDGDRLARFLKLRALMFRELYYSPYSRFFFDTFTETIIKYMYKNGYLTKEKLLQTDDSGLNSVIREFSGIDMFPLFIGPTEKSSFQKFENDEEATSFASGVNENPNQIAIVDNWDINTSSGVNKFFVGQEGKTIRFDEAFPNEAKEINSIVQSTRQINVYILSLDDLRVPMDKRKQLKEIFKITP